MNEKEKMTSALNTPESSMTLRSPEEFGFRINDEVGQATPLHSRDSNKYRSVITATEDKVARLAEVMDSAEEELEAALRYESIVLSMNT